MGAPELALLQVVINHITEVLKPAPLIGEFYLP
jgi:hypothetical protein